MANPEKAKQTNLLKRFGTTNIEEILGPEVLNCTRTLRSRMIEDWGFTSGCVAQWREGYVPKEIWERIKPFQDTLSRAKAASTHHNKTPEQKASVVAKLKATNLERYGVENAMQHPDIQSRCADSLEAHYGVRNPHESTELQQKINTAMKQHWSDPEARQRHLEAYANALSRPGELERRNAAAVSTNLAKYGVTNPSKAPEVKALIRSTNISRYGHPSPLGNPEVMAKRDATNISLYGSRSPFSSPEVRAKQLNTLESKYGVSNAAQIPEVRLKCSLQPEELNRRLELQGLVPLEPLDKPLLCYDNQIKVRCKYCGHEFATHLLTGGSSSLPFKGSPFKCCECQTHGAKLEWFARDYIREHYYPSAYQWDAVPWMSGKEIDIFIPELNIGFEINGYASHNSTHGYLGKAAPKPTDFHHFKSAACLEHGIKLYHFWYDADTPLNRERFIAFAKGVLEQADIEILPGDKLDRDTYPDPSDAGLPYTELPPEPFDTPNGLCYNSGYWLFHGLNNDQCNKK